MKKIAVMLPAAYRGGSLRGAKNLARGIAYQARERGDDLQVVFSYVSGKYNLHTDFADLIDAGISLRETVWEVRPREAFQGAAALLNFTESLEQPEYCLPSDGINDFYDCDLWLIVSDRLPAPLFPLRKNAFVVYDYIQRYVPDIFCGEDAVWNSQISNLIYSVRNASKVFVTTPSTRQDLISYAGVHPSRSHLLEMDFLPLEPANLTPDPELPVNYILWPTNTAHHKNHINALDAIEIYIQELGGDLHFLVTGTWTEYFDPARIFPADDYVSNVKHVQYVRDKLKTNHTLAKKLHILGTLSDRMYAFLLQHARFLWHPTLYDNGTFAVIEAAYLEVPSLSARYPAMEYINRKFDLNLQFFDPRNPRDMAEALFNMETAANSIPLPDRQTLLEHDWKAASLPLYQAVLELLW